MMKMGHISGLLFLLLPLCTLIIGTSIKSNNYGLYEMISANNGPEKPGRCPPQRHYAKAQNEICHTLCRSDWNCKENQKCCPDNCHHMCKPPAKEKPGTCPQYEPAFSPTGSCTDFCTTDAECHGTWKCCMKGCSRTCGPTLSDIGKPSVASTSRGGFCPQEAMYNCALKERQYCNSESCKDGYKCCPIICRMQCQEPLKEKAGECPASAHCPTETNGKACSSDYDCESLHKCCATCGNRCVKAVKIPLFLHNSTSTLYSNGGR